MTHTPNRGPFYKAPRAAAVLAAYQAMVDAIEAAGGVSVWRDGAGVPDNGLGNEGDYYLRTTNGDVYRKDAGVYAVVANIEGPPGEPGEPGSGGASGIIPVSLGAVAGQFGGVRNVVSLSRVMAGPASSGVALASGNFLLTHGFTLQKTGTLKRIGARVVGAGTAGCQFRIFIHDSFAGTRAPNASLFDSGNLAADAANTTRWADADLVLTGGLWYWVTIICQAVAQLPTFMSTPLAATLATLPVSESVVHSNAPANQIQKAQAFGGSPANYPAVSGGDFAPAALPDIYAGFDA